MRPSCDNILHKINVDYVLSTLGMSFGDTTQHKFWSHSGVLNATSEQIQRLEEDNSNDGYEHFSAKKNADNFLSVTGSCHFLYLGFLF